MKREEGRRKKKGERRAAQTGKKEERRPGPLGQKPAIIREHTTDTPPPCPPGECARTDSRPWCIGHPQRNDTAACGSCRIDAGTRTGHLSCTGCAANACRHPCASRVDAS
eukprot:208600-Rhodomonas_salina.2